MHTRPLRAAALLLLFALPSLLPAQALPTSPTTFKTKPVGAATSGAALVPTPAPLRQVTYLTLSPLRPWNSRDGKTLLGKLIAWEDTVTLGPPSPTPPSPPPKPTVLRQNKARLLIEKKACEIPLDRLSPEDQKFIQDLHARLAASP